jgi:hypothetical protein
MTSFLPGRASKAAVEPVVAVVEEQGVLLMSASVIGIVVICVVAVFGLMTWVIVVGRASRRPYEPNPQRGQMRGVVQGGMHVGGGRSVAPTRDAPVPEGGGEPPTIEQEVGGRRQDGPPGSPLDL